MIDMHTHVLSNADNGCVDYSDSGKIILEAINQGVTHMFLTPHQKSFVGYTNKELTIKFNNFKKTFEKRDIELFLGAEIDFTPDVIDKVKNKEMLTMNNTNFILLSFLETDTDYNIKEVINEFKKINIKCIIAHAECYTKLKFKDLEDIKNAGGYIQIDAETLFDKKFDKWLKPILKEHLIDFVASNIHSSKNPYIMKKAFDEFAKRTSKDYADLVFSRNQKNLLLSK